MPRKSASASLSEYVTLGIIPWNTHPLRPAVSTGSRTSREQAPDAFAGLGVDCVFVGGSLAGGDVVTQGPNGKIGLDIRDSMPDWAPYLAPKAPDGAPNVLYIAWDDVGYGTMDVFGGPVETPNMRRIADRGVRYSNFHTTALCSPTRASLLTGRNATSQRHGHHRRVQLGVPRHLDPDPVRERLHLRGARSSTATTPTASASGTSRPVRRCNLAAYKGRWPLGPGLRALLRLPRRRDQPVVSGPRPRQPPSRAAGDPGGGLPPRRRTSPTRRSSSSATRRSIDPDKPFFMYLAPDAGHAPHHVPRSGPTSTRARSTRATRRSARASSPGRRSSGCCPTTPSCRRSTRTASPPRPAPTASPGRCSTRCGRGTR